MSQILRATLAPEAEVPQSVPLPNQVPNSAGGYSFAVDDWTRFKRFLILGSEQGSYYARPQTLSAENAQATLRCIQEDGPRVINQIVEVSHQGRAPKNGPAIFALALAAKKGSEQTRKTALLALPQVCRIGTHLFEFASYIDAMHGWSRGVRTAISNWYQEKEVSSLVYQLLKYQQREGWSHRDLFRLAHPKARLVRSDLETAGRMHAALQQAGLNKVVEDYQAREIAFHWAVKGWESVGEAPHPLPPLRQLWAFERAKRATDPAEVVRLIIDYRLPREAIPTPFLKEPAVWEALLAEMPLTALLRNLATMTRIGLLSPSSGGTKKVIDVLGDAAWVKAARIHPLGALVALKTYEQGHGARGQHTWTPVPQVVDALDGLFYTAFGNVEPMHQRVLLALDVSGSMGSPDIAGMPGISPRVGSAAMAMVTVRTEEQTQFIAFSSAGYSGDGIVPLTFTKRQRLDDILKVTDALPFGGTDCALPMLWALKHKVPVDVFEIFTDSETWAGEIHPTVALRQYREQMGIPAKLVVIGMVSNGFSIANPQDAGQLDCVGFDLATPNLISSFARGEM